MQSGSKRKPPTTAASTQKRVDDNMNNTLPQKKLNDNKFRDLILPAVISILPVEMPYKLGILYDIYYKILPDWPGSKNKLRKTIAGILYNRCQSYEYQKALATSKRRYGIDGMIYELDESHRQEAQLRLKKIQSARNRHKSKKKKGKKSVK